MTDTKEDLVIKLHDIARQLPISGAGALSLEVRMIADRLAEIVKTEKQVAESWKHL